MLIYEKDNKLNINFDNEVNENPDLQIKKEDGNTSVKIDGQEFGGNSSSSEPLIVTFSGTSAGGDAACDKTWTEINQAYNDGKTINAFYYDSQYGLFGLQVSFEIANTSLEGLFGKDYSIDISNGTLVNGRECFISADVIECVST